MAEYYSARCSLAHGHVSFDEFHEFLSSDRDEDAILIDPSQWDSRHTPYVKGRRVIAALDAEIRRRTDGTSSFQDVARRLNERGGELDYRDFKRAVNAVVEGSIDDWIDEYARTSSAPPVPDDETLYRFENAVSDRCASCGTPIPPGVQKCSSCGLEEAEIADSGDSESDDSEEMDSDESTSSGDTMTGESESEDGDSDEDERDQESEDEGPTSVDRTGSRPCPVCNEPVELTDRFCPVCGHDFGNRVVESETATDSEPTEGTSAGPSQECPICGVNTPGPYCASCGSALQPVCQVCDQEVNPGAEFCDRCGHRV